MYEPAIKKSIEWMLKNQKPDGSFNYLYNPSTGEVSNQDNIIRQAGAAYILSETYKIYPSTKLLESIAKSMQYLQQASLTKTNSSAFIVIIYLNIDDNKFKKSFKELFETHRKIILNNQLPNGGFHRVINSKSKKHSSFADGELFLALTHLYNEKPSADLLEKMNFHFNFFDRHYRELIIRPNQDAKLKKYIFGFYSWGIRALNNFPLKILNRETLDFALIMTEFIDQNWQIKNNEITNLGVLLEGVASTYALSKKLNNPSQKTKALLQAGLENMLKLQIKEGGFLTEKNSANPQMRIDFTQHSLGALLISNKI